LSRSQAPAIVLQLHRSLSRALQRTLSPTTYHSPLLEARTISLASTLIHPRCRRKFGLKRRGEKKEFENCCVYEDRGKVQKKEENHSGQGVCVPHSGMITREDEAIALPLFVVAAPLVRAW
jgi:hypothetical protein